MLIRVGVFVVVLIIGLWLFAIVDVATSRAAEVRVLPKPVWLLVTVLLPLVGSVAWLLAGRPRVAAPVPGRAGGAADAGSGRPVPPARRGPLAPDDDPEFLRGLAERMRRTDGGDEPPEPV